MFHLQDREASVQCGRLLTTGRNDPAAIDRPIASQHAGNDVLLASETCCRALDKPSRRRGAANGRFNERVSISQVGGRAEIAWSTSEFIVSKCLLTLIQARASEGTSISWPNDGYLFVPLDTDCFVSFFTPRVQLPRPARLGLQLRSRWPGRQGMLPYIMLLQAPSTSHASLFHIRSLFPTPY
jgi:hypothetical protein